MLSFERELIELNASPHLVARERREVFSVHGEVRLLAWGGAMLVATGIGILVSQNLDRIGPLALAIAIGLLAIACYAGAFFIRTFVRDYVTLLGAMLVSADFAYIESQFHIFGGRWQLNFLVLALIHGIAAYAFRSPSVLALAIAALASVFGVDKTLFRNDTDIGWLALLASGAVGLWGAIDHLVAKRQGREKENRFRAVFEHAASNLALAGALFLTFDAQWRWVGLLLTLIAAAVVISIGFRRSSELFVIYAYAYAVIAIDVVVVDVLDENVLSALYLIVSSIAAIVGLFVLHGRFRRRRS